MDEVLEIKDLRSFVEIQAKHVLNRQKKADWSQKIKIFPYIAVFAIFIIVLTKLILNRVYPDSNSSSLTFEDWLNVLSRIGSERLLPIIGAMILFFFISKIFFRLRIPKTIEGRYVFHFREDTLEIEQDQSSARFPWDQFTSITRNESFWVLEIEGDEIGVLIPTIEMTPAVKNILERKISDRPHSPTSSDLKSEVTISDSDQEDPLTLILHYDEALIRQILQGECGKIMRILNIVLILALPTLLSVSWFTGSLDGVFDDPDKMFICAFPLVLVYFILIVGKTFIRYSWTNSSNINKYIQVLGSEMRVRLSDQNIEVESRGSWHRESWESEKRQIVQWPTIWKLEGQTSSIYFPLADLTDEAMELLKRKVGLNR